MINTLLTLVGKSISLVSRLTNRGHGSTWPGHIALSTNKNFIKDILKNSSTKIILIAGTNGKTTTAKLIRTILEQNDHKVIHNESGANLLNGIASALILNTDIRGNLSHDYAIFEVDENSLPLVLKELTPDYLVILNLFRDQLDRYGEINSIAEKWRSAIEQLNNRTILVLNADDPQVAYLGHNRKNTYYFGLDDRKLAQKTLQHASDSLYCPNCNTKLYFKEVYYSHLGNWMCPKCKLKRPELSESTPPKSSLTGIYNQYNVLAVLTLATLIDIPKEVIDSALQKFKPSFGRQEIIEVEGKSVQLFLSKNPTSFNQSLRTVKELNAKHLLIVLNDRIPDGRDVSWIWDVDTEEFLDNSMNIFISGDRAYDMGLRIKYSNSSKFPISNFQFPIEPNFKKAISLALQKTAKSEFLYVLPTYSAMLEVRKILTGKKIL